MGYRANLRLSVLMCFRWHRQLQPPAGLQRRTRGVATLNNIHFPHEPCLTLLAERAVVCRSMSNYIRNQNCNKKHALHDYLGSGQHNEAGGRSADAQRP